MQSGRTEKQAVIFNIQRFSIFDGPGIRTTVFFKGCNLRCVWCHNPESYFAVPEFSLDQSKCIGCGNCFRSCPNGCHRTDRDGKHVILEEECIHCFRCTDQCYARALSVIGKYYTPEQLMEELKGDIPYFRNSEKGGGITFSGGECMLQPDFLEEILKLCHENGISTAVDTAGNVPYESFQRTNPYTDYYLYDLKAFHPESHRRVTGVTNEKILDNFVRLKRDGKKIIVRIPVVPEINGEELPYIRDFLRENRPEKVELLPYHNMGIAKQGLLQNKRRQQEFSAPSKEQMKQYEELFSEFMLHVDEDCSKPQ